MDEYKIIFTGLGPNTGIYIEGKPVQNGDVKDVSLGLYQTYVNVLGIAVPHSEEVELKIKKLIESADKKRKQILDKVSKTHEGRE